MKTSLKTLKKSHFENPIIVSKWISDFEAELRENLELLKHYSPYEKRLITALEEILGDDKK